MLIKGGERLFRRFSSGSELIKESSPVEFIDSSDLRHVLARIQIPPTSQLLECEE
jgi:hypothetical protein